MTEYSRSALENLRMCLAFMRFLRNLHDAGALAKAYQSGWLAGFNAGERVPRWDLLP